MRSRTSDPKLINLFLDMLAAEQGAGANTLDAYRRDLGSTGGSAGSAGTGGNAGNGGSSGTSGTGGTAGTGGSAAEGGGTGGSTDASPGDGAAMRIAISNGTWTVFPVGDGGTAANPIMGIMGTAEALAAPNGGMRLTLSVTGLPASRTFGSHLHSAPCNMNMAGPHYQNMPFPDGGSATDPAYANPDNEAWLDFTTDASGAASSETTVDWRPRAGARAVVVHALQTMEGGVAGARLACTDITF